MMKRIFFLLVLSSILSFAALPIVFAANEPSTLDKKVNEILPPGTAQRGGENLPTGDFKKEIVPQIIKIFLALAGTVSFGVFVYAGIMLIISQGNEEEITKFKNILIWSIVGLAFITVSYALVRGVMQIAFE